MTTIRATHPEGCDHELAAWKAASITQTLTELFDNARRAGAKCIQVETHLAAGNITVAVSDDGRGIGNPATLLAYRASGWELRDGLDAPVSGCGLYALSAYSKSRIRTLRERDLEGHNGWEIELTPEHFAGKAEAAVKPVAGDTDRNGCEIRFEAGDVSRQAVWQAVRAAAVYMPTEVRCDGWTARQRTFLDDAVESTVAGGFRFGIYADDGQDRPNVRIHGRVVHGGVESVEVQNTSWSVRANAMGYIGNISLHPLDRAWLGESAGDDEFRRMAERVLFETLGRMNATAHATTTVHERARKAGVTLPPNQPWLERWSTGRRDKNASPRPEVVPPNARIVAFAHDRRHVPQRDGAVLEHAAGLDNRTRPLFAPDCRYEGQEWYDNLPRIVEIATEIEDGRQRRNVTTGPANGEVEDALVDRIVLRVQTLRGSGDAEPLWFETRYATTTPTDKHGLENASIYVSRESGASVEELTDLLMQAYFTNDDEQGPARNKKERRFRRRAEYRAMRLIAGIEAAERREIAAAIEDEVLDQIREQGHEHKEIVIRIRGREVEVKLGPR